MCDTSFLGKKRNRQNKLYNHKWSCLQKTRSWYLQNCRNDPPPTKCHNWDIPFCQIYFSAPKSLLRPSEPSLGLKIHFGHIFGPLSVPFTLTFEGLVTLSLIFMKYPFKTEIRWSVPLTLIFEGLVPLGTNFTKMSL